MAFLDPIVNAPRPQKIALGMLGMVVLGALAYFLVLSPRMAERDDLFVKNEDLRAQVLRARADEANLRQFRAQAEALRQRLAAAKERLPSEKEIPVLYRQLTDVAYQTGLAVSLFQPKVPEEREVVAEVPIQVTTEGNYHQLGAFLDRMGRMPRIVTLNDFRLVAIDRPTGTLRAEMTLATYMFRPEGAPPPAKPGAPPAKPPEPSRPPGASRAPGPAAARTAQ